MVALEIAEILHKKGYKIYLQLMDISNVDANGYLKLFAWENKDIIEGVYFADSKKEENQQGENFMPIDDDERTTILKE